MDIAVYTQTPHPLIRQQVLDMVKEYHTDLSMLGTPPSNHLYPIYNWSLVVEVDLYINRIGKIPEFPVELVIASDQGKVIGFVLTLPVATHPDACAVTYMAVAASARRRGVGSVMMKSVLARYPHTELTCFVSKVPFYEKLGFKVIDVRNTQLVMNTRDHSTEGRIGIVDANSIAQTSEAQALQDQLLQRWGRKEMVSSQKKLARHLEQLCSKAAAFLRERTDRAPHSIAGSEKV
jgi:ribosomal protein S18 acetylase RimI-like enzyme